MIICKQIEPHPCFCRSYAYGRYSSCIFRGYHQLCNVLLVVSRCMHQPLLAIKWFKNFFKCTSHHGWSWQQKRTQNNLLLLLLLLLLTMIPIYIPFVSSVIIDTRTSTIIKLKNWRKKLLSFEQQLLLKALIKPWSLSRFQVDTHSKAGRISISFPNKRFFKDLWFQGSCSAVQWWRGRTF